MRFTRTLPTIILVSAACLLGSACPSHTGPAPPPRPGTSADRPPVEASQEAKQADFRLNPPVVEDAELRDVGGKTLLAVKIAPDPRIGKTLTVEPDGEKVVLHDDGENGDATAGDRVFSAFMNIDMVKFRNEQNRRLERIRVDGDEITVPRFDGRVKVGIDRLSRRALLRTDLLKIILAGFPQLVNSDNSLTVTNVSVVEDPTRTFNPCSNTGNATGVWTFGHLMTEMANQAASGVNPAELTRSWLETWLTPQTANTFNVPARPNIGQIINAWPKLANGDLDLTKAPVRLLAIVNRIDLAASLAYGRGSGGEGRFVFGVMDVANGCAPTPFLIIFEYGIPRHTCAALRDWAQKWLALGSLPLGSPQYNTALEVLTEEFAKANAEPTKPNGSAINQVRTNEIALAAPWELREFNLLAVGGAPPHLHLVTVKQNPDQTFNEFPSPGPNGPLLAQWINLNETAIIAERHTVADVLAPAPPFPTNTHFLGASSPNSQFFWKAAGITNNNARFHFSLNTCNGCHGRETQTSSFTHIGNAPFGTPAPLSGFLTGITVSDPVQGNINHDFADLERRKMRLEQLANSACFPFSSFRPLIATH